MSLKIMQLSDRLTIGKFRVKATYLRHIHSILRRGATAFHMARRSAEAISGFPPQASSHFIRLIRGTHLGRRDATENPMARTAAGSRSGMDEYELHGRLSEQLFRAGSPKLSLSQAACNAF